MTGPQDSCLNGKDETPLHEYVSILLGLHLSAVTFSTNSPKQPAAKPIPNSINGGAAMAQATVASAANSLAALVDKVAVPSLPASIIGFAAEDTIASAFHFTLPGLGRSEPVAFAARPVKHGLRAIAVEGYPLDLSTFRFIFVAPYLKFNIIIIQN